LVPAALALILAATAALAVGVPALQEAIFPTAAVVRGQVVRDGNPVGAVVVLDDSVSVPTDGAGEFVFRGVRAGNHTLAVEEDGQTVFVLDFDIERDASWMDLGPLDLGRAAPITRTPDPASPASPQATPRAASD
jgi:hypothetical protein